MKFLVFVEIAKGSSQKYEFDEDLKRIKLDRILYGPVYFPFNYGFIEKTKGEDNDPLDCVVLSSASFFPGCVVECRPIGLLEMEDEAGIDTKILAAPLEKIDPGFQHFQDVADLPDHLKRKIKEFFEIYKRLEPQKWVKLKEFKNREEAERVIKESMERKKEGC